MPSGIKIKLANARLGFPHLFTPMPGEKEGDTPKYGCSFIFPPKDPQLALVRSTMKQAAQDKWGKDAELNLKTLIAGNRVCLRDGATKAKHDGFDGNMFISASNAVRPLIVDADGRTQLTPRDGRPYAGCYVNCSVEIWAQDNKFGQRINASLVGVMFVRDGEPFAGGAHAEDDEFESFAPTEEEGNELV